MQLCPPEQRHHKTEPQSLDCEGVMEEETMKTTPIFCMKALIWSVVVFIACMICIFVDHIVSGFPYRLSALFMLVPCAISMTYLGLLHVANLERQIADMKRELEKGKENQ